MATQNPLFPSNTPQDQNSSGGYILPQSRDGRNIQPLNDVSSSVKGRDEAANVIRQKLEKLYADEPAAEAELQEIEHHHRKPSKHQERLQQIQNEATSVADIQTKWHEYYAQLPENEKHEVWQEFYAEQSKHSRYAQFANKQSETQPKSDLKPVHERSLPQKTVVSTHEIATPSASAKRIRDARSARDVQQTIREKVSASSNSSSAPSPLRSLFFGLGTGAIVLLIMLFGLFNELIVTPFIQPSRSVSATPIILSTDGIAADEQSKVIIPKINVEIPTDYSLTSLEEDIVQEGLEKGVVHYPITSKPGEQGNAAFFGHSSNNLFNPGEYKFAFVLLNKLEDGDMFYLTRDGVVYAYRVFQKEIVAPSDTWVLDPVEGKAATAVLITCDPPGTTLKRLVVWGEQISPSPEGLQPSTATTAQATPEPLPGPPESLWDRMTGWFL